MACSTRQSALRKEPEKPAVQKKVYKRHTMSEFGTVDSNTHDSLMLLAEWLGISLIGSATSKAGIGGIAIQGPGMIAGEIHR